MKVYQYTKEYDLKKVHQTKEKAAKALKVQESKIDSELDKGKVKGFYVRSKKFTSEDIAKLQAFIDMQEMYE